MISFLAQTGVRLSELCHLRLADVVLDAEGLPQALRVIGKGNKERRIPLAPGAVTLLRRWLRERELHPLRDDALFVNLSGRSKYQPLTARIVWYLVRQAAARAGIEPVKPHTLRHTCATQLYLHGAGIVDIQHILGHENLATTGIYTKTDDAMQARAMRLMPDFGAAAHTLRMEITAETRPKRVRGRR